MGKNRIHLAIPLYCILAVSAPWTHASIGIRAPHALQDNGGAAGITDGRGRTGIDVSGGAGLLEDNSGMVRRTVEVDLEAGTVSITETVGGVPVRHPFAMPLEPYVSRLTRLRTEREWREMDPATEASVLQSGYLQVDIPVEFPKAISRHIGSGGQLRVSGYRKIEFAGHSQWTTEQQTDYKEGTAGWIPNLEMEQESEFKIEGKIGDKIHVYVDQSTERLSEMENSIKINYTGDEDEIIQSIEAGNTSLSLPNTHFVSANEKHKGLFGIKVKMKIGYLDLTAIASQQKGAAEKKSIPLGASLEEQIIKDYNYKKRTYYSFELNPDYKVTDIDVFVANTGTRTNDFDTAFVMVEARDAPRDNGTFIDTLIAVKPTKLQFDKDYKFVRNVADDQLAYIQFTTSRYIGEKELLGVTYTYKDAAGTEREVGGIDGRNVRLKLIKSVDPDTTLRAWEYEWKNVYDLGSGGVDETGFMLDIYKQPEGGGDAQPAQGNTRYVDVFGIGNGKGQINKSSTIIDFRRGELIFPDPQPFNSDSLIAADRVPAIYESPRKFESSQSRFFMKVLSRSIKKTYDLGYMNIIKGSEAVMLDGVKLPSSAYTIRYETGQITFRTEDVYKPGADVSVTFEYMPFFTPDQKTLLGMRAELKFWENSHVGFTSLYKRQTTLDRRIQLGREPTQGLIWDVDAAFKFKPKWMTRMVDALPLISTETPSALEVSGEFAQSYSDPNTEGEAIIDDFEGSRLSTDLGIIRNTWTDASRPDTSFGQAFPAEFSGTGADSAWMEHKGKVNWFNPVGDDRVKVIDIWPERAEDVYTVDDEQNVLKVRFTPAGNDTLSWGGLMQYMYEGYHDQTDAKYLELWVRGGRGKVTFDLGKVSEDVIPNGELDSEDKNDDGILSEDEDVGLDGLADGDEPAGTDDNYRYSPGTQDYARINGTEGNFTDPLRYNQYDTEDLDDDGNLTEDNDYFSVTVDLADTQYVVPGTYAWDRKKTTERDPDFSRTADWRQYRIPLWNIADNPLRTVGSPKTYLIKYARMWFTGFDRADSVSFASLEIVGNEWLEQGQNGPDTAEFSVSVKNAYENADYEMPEPVREQYEEELNTFETETATFNEQSLAIAFAGLMPGRSVAAYNDNLFQELDFTNYRTLKFYLNGVDAPTDGSIDFFIRFGSDSSNFYGIRVVPEDGWTASNPVAGWKEYEFDLAKLTTLKLKALNADSLERALAGGTWSMTADDAVYEVRGNPTMSAVDWMQVGVAHDPFSAGTARGEIWLDDLILTDPKAESGNAARFSLNTVLADLARFTGNFEYRDDGFRSLNESVESLREQRKTTMSGNLALGRFFPKKWGVSLPVTGTVNESEDLPRYKPGTDIELVNDDDRRENRTERINRRATAAFKKNGRSDNPLLAYTIDRIDLDYTLSRQYNRYTSPSARIDTTEIYEAALRYNLTPSGKPSLKPFGFLAGTWMPDKLAGMQLFYLPNNLNSQFALHHEYSKSEDISIAIPSIDTTREFTSKYELGYMPFSGLNLTYGLDLVNDALGHLTGERIAAGQVTVGDELQRTQDVSVQFRPNLFRFWSQSYTYRVNYNEDADPTTIKLSGTNTRDIQWSRDYGLDYTWSLVNLKNLLPHKAAVDAKPFSRAWLVGYLKNGAYYTGELLPSVTTRYKMTENTATYGLTGRPDAAYRFGFKNDHGVSVYGKEAGDSTGSSTANDSESKKEQKDLGVTSSLRVGPVNLQMSYDYAFKDNIVYDKMTYDRTQTLPRLTLQVRSLEKLPYLEKVVRTSTVNSSFSRDITESGELERHGSWVWYVDGEREKEKLVVKNAFNPLFKWQLQWKNKVSTSLDYQRTTEQSRNYEGTNKRSRKRNQTFSLTTQYSFSAPHGIKFWKLKNIKFNRSLNTSLTLSLGSDVKDYLLEGDGKYTEEEKQSNWSVNTQAKYNFSSKVEGGLQVLASQNRKRLPTKLTNNEAKLAIWAQLKF